ncbi:hypothetical protein VHEMI04592 [[Torrubiella] hemipterigena]|uniref:ABC transporter domain-containing protein n=1 Tax=[Torrubiella] hemipterigena TaxID=1531966 RepID=A0A0A1TED7_9HYPO|nr:hypothetical protein VHEMI04592 [[Torrubiella] hemipterigena]
MMSNIYYLGSSETALLLLHSVSLVGSLLLYGAAVPRLEGKLLRVAKPIRLLAFLSKVIALATFATAHDWPNAITFLMLGITIASVLVISDARYLNVFQDKVAAYIFLTLDLFFDTLITPQYSIFFASTILQSIIIISILTNLTILVLPPDDLEEVASKSGWSLTTPVGRYIEATTALVRGASRDTGINLQPKDVQQSDQDYIKSVESDLAELLNKHETANKSERVFLPPLYAIILSKRLPIIFSSVMSAILAVSQILLLLNSMALFTLSLKVSTATYIHFILATITLYMGLALTRAKTNFSVKEAIQHTQQILSSAIIQKTMRLRQSQANDSNALHLLKYDVEAIDSCLHAINIACQSILIFCFANIAVLLTTNMTISLTLIAVSAKFAHLNFINASTPDLADISKRSETLLTSTKEMLKNIINIKIMGLEDHYATTLQAMKQSELQAWIPMRHWQLNFSVGSVALILTPTCIALGNLVWRLKVDGVSIDCIAPVSSLLSLLVAFSFDELFLIRSLPRLNHALQRIDEFLDIAAHNESAHSHEPDTPEPPKEASAMTVDDKTDNQLIHRTVTLDLKPGTLNVFCRPITSEKTTFLHSLSREINITTGSIDVLEDTVGYCGEDIMLQDKTIRKNITGSSAWNKFWYLSVVRVCYLWPEFNRFPHKDKTVVGANGPTISVDLRIRIILARAIYSKAPILLLENVFPAFDETAARDLVRSLSSRHNGFLRHLGTITVLAAHSFPIPDFIDCVYDVTQFGVIKRATIDLRPSSSLGSNVPNSTEPKTQRPKLHNNESVVEVKKSIPQLLKFVSDKFVDKQALLTSAGFQLAYVSLEHSLESTIWSDNELQNHSLYYFVAHVLRCSLALGFYYMELRTFKLDLCYGSSATLQDKNSSVLETLLTDDMFAITKKLPTTMAVLHLDCYQIIADFSMLLMATKYTMWTVTASIVMLHLVQRVFVQVSKTNNSDLTASYMKFITGVSNAIDGLTYTHSFRWQPRVWARLLSDLRKCQAESTLKAGLFIWLTTSVDFIIAWIMCCLAILFVSNPGDATPPALGFCILIACRLCALLPRTIMSLCELDELQEPLQRMHKFYTEFESEKVENPVPFQTRPVCEDSIEFNQAVVRGCHPITGVAEPGMPVTISGRSGSGKSSVLSALLGLLPYDGSIKINGCEVRTMDPRSIRKHIAIITQEPFDIPGTVDDNLFLYKLRNPEITGPVYYEITENILQRLEVLNSNRIRYNTPFTQLRLPYGKKQGMSIARTALHKFQTSNGILLMDDVCGRIDELTAETYREVVRECFFGTVSIMVETTDDDLTVTGLQPLLAIEDEEEEEEEEELVEDGPQ